MCFTDVLLASSVKKENRPKNVLKGNIASVKASVRRPNACHVWRGLTAPAGPPGPRLLPVLPATSVVKALHPSLLPTAVRITGDAPKAISVHREHHRLCLALRGPMAALLEPRTSLTVGLALLVLTASLGQLIRSEQNVWTDSPASVALQVGCAIVLVMNRFLPSFFSFSAIGGSW